MDDKLIIESLSPIERALIPKLSEDFIDIDEIVKETSQDKTTILRAVSYLKNKGLAEVDVKEKKEVVLGILGLNYLKKELPERSLLNGLAEKKVIPIGEIKHECGLNDNEAKISLGTLKKKALAEVKSGKIYISAKPEEITKKMIEETFLEKLPLNYENLEPEDKLAFQNLLKRKDIIKIEEKKKVNARLTKEGLKISKMDLSGDLIEQLTPKLLKQNGWKGKKFRRYDLSTPAPRIYGGKRHFVNQAKDYAKSIWLEMGFKEMSGKKVVTGFYNFDTLFTAQDHPVREEQDTFYIKNLKGKLPDNKELLEQIRKSHEGGIDKSKGWETKWDENEAKKVLLRTHTTALSTKQMIKIVKEKEFPAKYFALGKCFRNETVDWSHGFEFNQTEGIVVDENANFRQLLGYLINFCKKMGYDKIRVRPGYFPYTEPSVEMDVFDHNHQKWVELVAAGMFRPEVVVPIFGKFIPVLAWGPGLDRIIMGAYELTDLRDMYKNDINKLREMKFWRK